MDDDGIPEATPDMDGEMGMGPPLVFGPRDRFGVDVAAVPAEDGPPAPGARVVAPADVDDGDARIGMGLGLDEVEAMRRLTDGGWGLCVCSGTCGQVKGVSTAFAHGGGWTSLAGKRGGAVEDDTMFRLIVVDGSVTAMCKRGKRFCYVLFFLCYFYQ